MKISILLTIGLLLGGLALSPAIAAQDAGKGSAGPRFHYLFENPRFLVMLQEIDLDGAGHGTYRFRKKDQDEIVVNFDATPALVSQLQGYFDSMNFLASAEDYQHKKDFSHLGTKTIAYSRGGKERTVKFNYTDNQPLNRIADLFLALATQENRYFELDAIRANDPISTPAQLRYLEGELRSKQIAEPVRFEKVLQEIRLDEGVPLIARNHADRLLQFIKKGK